MVEAKRRAYTGEPRGKYYNVKIRQEVVELLKSCQLPHEPLSDTLNALMDFSRVARRQQERKRLKEEEEREQAQGR